MAKDSRLERAGVSGYNKPKRTPNHPTKSHVVVAKSGDQIRLFVMVNKVSLVQDQTLRLHRKKQDVNLLKQDTLRTSLKVKCLRHIGQTNQNGNRRHLCHKVKVHTVVKLEDHLLRKRNQ